MNLITLPRRIAAMEYAAFRFPLGLIEREVLVRRLPEEAPLRLRFERFLGALDTTAGRVLADDAVERRGEALTHRADLLEKAARLDREAETRRAELDDSLRAEEDEARQVKAEAEHQQRAMDAGARRSEQEAKQRARQAADTRARTAKAEADRTAARRVRAAEEAKRVEHDRIDLEEKQATAAPKEKLADAQRKRIAAREQRVEADRLGQLAAAERRRRRSE
jgi:hypothetical protein